MRLLAWLVVLLTWLPRRLRRWREERAARRARLLAENRERARRLRLYCEEVDREWAKPGPNGEPSIDLRIWEALHPEHTDYYLSDEDMELYERKRPPH